MRECSSAVSSRRAASAAIGLADRDGDRHLGPPHLAGWPLVQIRWAPQTMCGTIGTSAAIAMRAAPDLNSLISKLRLIVASG